MDTRAPTDVTRRSVLRTAAIGAAGLPVLAACGGGDEDPTATSSATGTPGHSARTALASTGDIKVGGAVFLDQPPVVITQPSSGDFHAFDRTCTHEQCLVSQITDGLILCTCHNSVFDMRTGDNVGGPAPAPLAKVDITVRGGQIVEA